MTNLQSSSSPELLQRSRATRTTTQTSITIPRPSTTIIKGILRLPSQLSLFLRLPFQVLLSRFSLFTIPRPSTTITKVILRMPFPFEAIPRCCKIQDSMTKELVHLKNTPLQKLFCLCFASWPSLDSLPLFELNPVEGSSPIPDFSLLHR